MQYVDSVSTSWRLYREPTRFWRVFDPALLSETLDEIFAVAEEANPSTAVAGWIAYEAAPYLSADRGGAPEGREGVASGRAAERPLLEFAQFSRLSFHEYLEPPGALTINPTGQEWDRETYLSKFEIVKKHLSEGRNYQTNLTFATTFETDHDAAELFSAWCGVTPPPFATLCRLGTDIVSLSPELFFAQNGPITRCRPMKGTAPAGSDPELLRSDPKTRAENLMITDMVRNDLHSLGGVVQMECDLFQVEEHRTVLQMTSKVTCTHNSALPETFKALFPAASVTGAPKAETLRIISELEDSPRGVYCGALGVLWKGRARFSVPIRTADKMEGSRWRYRVGSGIVWDSEGDREYDECLLKAEVIRTPAEGFGLIETLCVKNGQVALLEGHAHRLGRGCESFGLEFDVQKLAAAIQRPNDGVYRLVVWGNNEITVEKKSATPEVVRVPKVPRTIGTHPLHWIGEKTTDRRAYGSGEEVLWCSTGYEWIKRDGSPATEMSEPRLLEFTTGSLVVQLDGDLYTPPMLFGEHVQTLQLLPGVARAHWLATGKLKERVLTLADLDRAEAVFHLNAARGLRPVEFVD